jgi:dihydroorotate dehydrogenase
MYKFLIRPILFLFDPEKIHHFTYHFVQTITGIPVLRQLIKGLYSFHHPSLERKILGFTFKNPVGLAAGFDKDAKMIGGLSCFGFGFIEVGTLTPQPQPGNPQPRLFRLKRDRALINRMGFNNEGVERAASRLKRRRSEVIVGGNIGKNKFTENANAVEDYLLCFEELYPVVDYFVLNVSSPNTPGLRELQDKEPLRNLMTIVKQASLKKENPKPVLLKIAPDLTVGQLDDVIDMLIETGADGIIATNTTISREGLTIDEKKLAAIGAGGLSGKPLTLRSVEVIKYLRSRLGPEFPIIGVGGIMSVQDALDKLDAGADLIQIYTGFIYEGPAFARRINRAIVKRATG